ncbi:MAG: YeeE/YedE thiosulfate transporter family protein [Bacillota bacterium]
MVSPRLFALLAPTGVVAVAWALREADGRTAVMWLMGVLLGVALQRSRFCVAAAYRDALLFRDTGVTRAILLALILSTLTFAWIQFQQVSAGGELPGQIQSVSAGTVGGSLLFGIGIIPAGGCACSTLLRVGEGHLRFLYTLLGLVAGSVLGAYHFEWWSSLAGTIPPVHLPSLLGWPQAVALQGLVLGGLLWLAGWWERHGEAHP